jgi:hypothetical protein
MTKKWGNTQSKFGIALPENINSRGREISGLSWKKDSLPLHKSHRESYAKPFESCTQPHTRFA